MFSSWLLAGSFFAPSSVVSSVDRSRSFHRVRSQSFFSRRLHLKSSLRESARSTASARAVSIQSARHGNVLCDHPAKPSSSQSDPRRSGIAPERSMTDHGLSKARRDRDGRHDRCNPLRVVSSSAFGYQRVTHGISKPNCLHKSTAAAYRLRWCTAAHSSNAFPCDPQRKQWYRPSRTFTENERLPGLRDP